jgi:hypothetical protein
MAVQRVLLAMCLAALASHAIACTVTGIDVTKASVAAKPSDSNAYALTGKGSAPAAAVVL